MSRLLSTHWCQCFTIAVRRDTRSAFDVVARHRGAEENHIPSVESTIVPSKSESTPSKVRTSAGAEKDPAAVEDIVGAGLRLSGNMFKCPGEEKKNVFTTKGDCAKKSKKKEREKNQERETTGA